VLNLGGIRALLAVGEATLNGKLPSDLEICPLLRATCWVARTEDAPLTSRDAVLTCFAIRDAANLPEMALIAGFAIDETRLESRIHCVAEKAFQRV